MVNKFPLWNANALRTRIATRSQLSNNVSQERLEAIDALRGIAVLAVVLLHAREILWIGSRALWLQYGSGAAPLHALVGYATTPLRYGYYAVMLFFVLSGYCIHRANIPQRGRRHFEPWYYAKRRLIRIYPVLLATLVLTAIIDNYVRAFYPFDDKLGDDGPSTFLINALALQNFLGPCYGSNGPLWSLSIEVHLYALYPLLLFLRNRYGPTVFFWVPITTSLAMGAMNYIHPTWPANALTYLVVWSSGCLVAETEAGTWAAPSLPYRAMAILALLAAPLLGYFGATIAESWMIGVPSAMLLAWVVRGSGRSAFGGFLGNLLRRLGFFSYSLYATHLPILVLFRAVILSDERSPYIYWVFVAVFVCVVAARVFFQLVERVSITSRRPGSVKSFTDPHRPSANPAKTEEQVSQAAPVELLE